MQELIEPMLTGKPYPIKGLVSAGTNLFHAIPRVDRTKQALENLDFFMAIDILPQEYTQWADVILPEASYLERYDELLTVSHKTPFITFREPAIKPLYDAKPGWWIARELGVRLGLEQYFPWKTIEEYLDYRLASIGSSLEDAHQRGVYIQKGRPYLADYEKRNQSPPFNTPSGKIEIYLQRFADHGLDPIPQYEPIEEPPKGYFRLIFGRAPVHSFSRTQNNAYLSHIMPENEVWLNAGKAAEVGVQDGDRVILENQAGVKSQPIKVKVTQRIRGDVVYMVHGFGHRAPGMKLADGKGASDSELLSEYKIDPVCGAAGLRVNFVKIRKLGAVS